MGEVAVRLQSLHLYPIRSCAGVEVRQALLVETGLELDRAWMVVDANGNALETPDRPRFASIQTRLRTDDMVLRAPGMLALHVALDAVEEPTVVRLGGRRLDAYDMGALSAQWFSDFLGERVRLVRFDPEQAQGEARYAEPGRRGPLSNAQPEIAFQDRYPLRLVSSGALAVRSGTDPGAESAGTTWLADGFNLVVAGLAAEDEARVEEWIFDSDEGAIRLRRVGPDTSRPASESTAVSGGREATGRDGSYLEIVEGIDRVLHVGMPGRALLGS